ncbi:MAG: YbaK/EbsC family protein [Calditrichia bacterium]
MTQRFCDNCGIASKREIARFRKETFADAPPKPLEKVHTPATASIEALSKFLKLIRAKLPKWSFWGNFGKRKPEKLIVCVIRGDMETSDALVRQLSGAHALRPAEPEEIAAVGCVPGFASAIDIDRKKTLVIADELIATSANLVTGANETDYHLLNSNYGRDYDSGYRRAYCPATDRCPLRQLRRDAAQRKLCGNCQSARCGHIFQRCVQRCFSR